MRYSCICFIGVNACIILIKHATMTKLVLNLKNIFLRPYNYFKKIGRRTGTFFELGKCTCL